MQTIPVINSIIKPSNIETSSNNFMATLWQNSETETSAYWLCKFANSIGEWRPFTKKQIDEFSNHDFRFNRLTKYGSIKSIIKGEFKLVDCDPYELEYEDFYSKIMINNSINKAQVTQKVEFVKTEELYYFTDGFIAECYRVAPAKTLQTGQA